MKQLHKRFSSEQVKELLNKYEQGNVERQLIEEMLGIAKAQFFRLLKKFREDENFSIDYQRQAVNRQIETGYDDLIRQELQEQYELIKMGATFRYNYSYAVKEIHRKFGAEISDETVRTRAKQWGFYKERRKSQNKHDRLVITNNTGELIQHDSSHHWFAPLAKNKWYLITSLDDFSRLIVEARFVEAESTVEHIKSLERVFVNHGFPYSYYTDSHSIFRFVAGRDEMLLHHNSYIQTDGVDTQWQQVLNDCGVLKRNALSPQAKGKIERPYQWLQDHIVRRCMSEKITSISQGQQILNEVINFYNYKNVHSSTGEVPYYRFQRAKQEGNNLWRSFIIPKPFLANEDIFALRLKRHADGYRKISLKNLKLAVNGLNPYDDVDIRIYKIDNNTSKLRFWRNELLLDTQIIKNDLLKGLYH